MSSESPIEFEDLSIGSKAVLVTFTVGIIVLSSIQIIWLLLALFYYIRRQIQTKFLKRNSVPQKQSVGSEQVVQEEQIKSQNDIIQSSGSVDYLPTGLQCSPLLLSSLLGHLNKVAAVSISPDAKRIATCCMDNVLRIYQLDSVSDQTPKFLRIKLQKAPLNVTFGSDFSQLALVTAEQKNQSTLAFFDSVSGQILKTQSNIHDNKACTETSSSAISPLGVSLLITCATSRELKIFNFSGKLYGTIELDSYNDIHALTISGDGRFVCAANNEKKVFVWEILVDNHKQYRGCQKFAVLDKHNEGVVCCAFSPDSKRVATVAIDGLRVWNLNTGNQTQNNQVKLVLKMPLPLKDGGCYQCLCWGQERVIIGSIGSDIHFINAGNGRFEDCLRSVHRDSVRQIKCSQMSTELFGRIFVTCGQDNQVLVFRIPQIE